MEVTNYFETNNLLDVREDFILKYIPYIILTF